MKKALQFNDTPSASNNPRSCQSPGVQEEEPGGDRTLSGHGLFLEGEQNSVLNPHCGEQMRQSLDSDCYSSETRLKDSGETRLDISSPVGPGPPRNPESRPYHAKILQLFSTPHKGSCSGVERLRPATAWPAISGLRVMGSFKKLRSSILQGIQNRAATAANQEMEHGTEGNPETGHSTQEAEYSTAATQHKSEEGQGVVNGLSLGEDTWDEEGGGGEGLNRNSRFSRSLRMAYEDGRITLLQVEAELNSSSPLQLPAPTALSQELLCPPAPIQTTANAIARSRLSTSADNLHFFRGPFRRRPPCPQHGDQQASVAHGIKRTASTSSVVPRNHSPLHIRAQVQKLVCSMNDLSVRQRSGPAPAPSPCSDRSALSRLHDDYSRRVPCYHDSERQRRCLAVRSREANKEHNMPFLESESAPGSDPSPSGLSSVSSQACAVSDILQGSAPFEPGQIEGWDSLRLPQGVLDLQTEDTSAGLTRGTQEVLEDRSSEQELEVAQLIETPVSDTPTCGDGTPTSNTTMIAADEPSPATCTPVLDLSTSDALVCTADPPSRRVGRTRPRPLSDYGQLVGRKISIPEEDAEYPNEEARRGLPAEYNSNGISFSKENHNGKCGHSSSHENCNGNSELRWSTSQENQHRKQRPISVIGGVDLYSSPSSEEKEDLPDSRPPLPSHQVPPYRGVSVRLRPCTLSQSTPVGLDRLGQPRLHRILSDGGPGGTEMLDDSVSEEDCSFDELSDIILYLQPGAEHSALNEWISSGQVVYAEALWDHVTMEEQELGFKAGDVIRVLDASNKDWWWGAASGLQAWFPSSFVRVRVNQEDGAVSMALDSVENVQAKEPVPGATQVQSTEHRDQMRANVVNEIMNTERIYIKHLRDICEGYLRQCRKHTGMFTQLQINTIFSNIEDIYRFHRKFLKNLERYYNKEQPHQSQIGSCFLLQSEFSIYSEYCNNHPHACAELQRLLKLGRYRHFFEACRLLQQMIDISVAGFLLTPVQKICKYPLQLGELLKYTPPEHRDHSSVSDAYEAMKKVACLINERKRRLESLDTIAHWQETILRWEGEGVLCRSSDLIHSGDLSRVFPEGKTQQRVFFLFDHQMVFCKKDVLRRDLLFYCGRLDTDRMQVLDVPDGRDRQLGLSLKNAFRLQDRVTHEEYVFCTKKATDKRRWLQAFANERRRVQEDQELGMEISESQRRRAILRARKSKNGKLRNLGYAGCSVPLPHQLLHPLHQRHVTVPTCIPQQPVFSLAEPKRKPSHLWDTLFRK
ncbi:uncharacterized protein spata13 isoform X2 [Anguilla anguilla]|uniref:uncharacterized protein spata13 isoform X2 n=1 Tax=Anguilla anguilla TaxID=7936 RepID=UPI0015B14423|nr:uncharacterized protein spata13 isoform X2 [Anguilla anguilla]